MRKMATIRQISNILPIDGADAIECAIIDGWSVVIKKGEYSIGDHIVYCEIDSWIPHELAPFLSKGKEPREYNGVRGERLRTIKLRGQISQGLVLPIDNRIFKPINIGDDVSEILNIQKWDAPIPAELAGTMRGNFPPFIPKTDQERIQNLSRELTQWNSMEAMWEVTEKLDGSSMTVYIDMDSNFGVCSRNIDLIESETNTFWKVARELDLETKIRSIGYPVALQGELIGEGIQGNPYNIKGHSFMVFDIFNITTQNYMSSGARGHILEHINISQVPVVFFSTTKNETVESLLVTAEGKSILNPAVEREGLVFKRLSDPDISFKVISNKFLLKAN